MCLEIKRSKFNRFLQDKLSIICSPKPKKAKKDIIVYKVLRTDTTIFPRSINYPFTWDFDYIYSTDLSVCIRTKLPYLDFHCVEFIINEGYHAFVNKDLAFGLASRNTSQFWKVHKAIIPKGSKYYIGTHGDIVSDRLKIIERID